MRNIFNAQLEYVTNAWSSTFSPEQIKKWQGWLVSEKSRLNRIRDSGTRYLPHGSMPTDCHNLERLRPQISRHRLHLPLFNARLKWFSLRFTFVCSYAPCLTGWVGNVFKSCRTIHWLQIQKGTFVLTLRLKEKKRLAWMIQDHCLPTCLWECVTALHAGWKLGDLQAFPAWPSRQCPWEHVFPLFHILSVPQRARKTYAASANLQSSGGTQTGGRPPRLPVEQRAPDEICI